MTKITASATNDLGLGQRTSSRISAGKAKGKKGGADVEQTEAEKKIPAKKTSDSQVSTFDLFMRGVKEVPNALGYLASSTYKAVKEVFLEGLVSYFVFSKAGNVADSISRATGADFNGMMGVLTVPVRKLATKAASGLWNLRPGFMGNRPTETVSQTNKGTENKGAENKGTEDESLTSTAAKKKRASVQDADVPAAVDSATGSSKRRNPPTRYS